MKRAFTLIEMMISIAIIAVVTAELALVLVGLFRMQKDRMWNAEFSDRLRVARENILFKAVPTDGTYHYGGLLSATNIVWSANRLAANFQRTAKDSTPEYDQTQNRISDRFDLVALDDGDDAVSDVYVTNDMLFVSVRSTIADSSVPGGSSNRVERLAVPAFGKTPTIANPEAVSSVYAAAPWSDFIKVTSSAQIQWRSR